MPPLNPVDILRNPLAKAADPESFLRLCLAEAAGFGMPGDCIQVLDDIAAMIGFYKPVGLNQASHLAAPLIHWRTHPDQPAFERVFEVECLAYKQRALIAFGGGKPGQMVGSAEIVNAIGNTLTGATPPEFYEVFQWASLDVLRTLSGDTTAEILARKKGEGEKWRDIPDDEVLKPTGRLFETYQTIATTIRRSAIATIEKRADHPRTMLRPIAANFLETHHKVRREAEIEGLAGVVKRVDAAIAIIRDMYPDLGTLDEEIEAQEKRIETAPA